MKKIMLITSSGQIGGLEKITATLWKELKKEFDQVKVVKIFQGVNEVYFYEKDEIVIMGNKRFIENNFFKKVYRLIKDIIIISYYKQKYSIDVSIAMGEMCSIINGLTISKDYKIGSIHGKKVTYNNFFIKYVTNLSFKRISKLISISEGLKDEITQNFQEIDRSKLVTIYNPHDFNNIQEKSKEKIPENIEIIFDKKVVLFVGRIDDNKGVSHLLKIFYEKEKELEEYSLVIIGKIEEELKYKNRVKNVHFLGPKKNPYKYIKRAYVTILSSYSEGLPNVLIESLVLNTPIISTNSSKGIWEIVDEKRNIKCQDKDNIKENYIGDVGIITPTLKSESLEKEELSEEEIKLYEAIISFEDFRDKFKRNIKDVLKKFCKKEIVKKYLKIIQDEK